MQIRGCECYVAVAVYAALWVISRISSLFVLSLVFLIVVEIAVAGIVTAWLLFIEFSSPRL